MNQTRAKTKKDVVTEFRTSAILSAAHRVFAEKGFHEATIDEVAKAAKVAKGTVYLYYRSKHDLYWAALQATGMTGSVMGWMGISK